MNDELFESDYEGEAVLDEQEADFESELEPESEDVEIELAAELLSLSGEEELATSMLMREPAYLGSSWTTEILTY